MKTLGVEEIKQGAKLLAIVVRGSFNEDGCTFVSPNEFPFQLGLHKRKAGEHTKPHKHLPFEELKNIDVQELLYIESGSIRVDIYSNDDKFFSVDIAPKDMILLNCAHEVTFLEETKMIELKQGPYRGKDVEKEYLK
jgi:hypothetical protein